MSWILDLPHFRPWCALERAAWLGLLSFLSLTILAAHAAGAEPGVYVEALVGVATAGDSSVPQRASVMLDVTPKAGATVSGAVGYRFENPVRVEINAAHQRNSLAATYQERIQVLIFPPCGQPNRPCLGPNVTGRIVAPSFLAMTFYDFRLADRLNLSVGAGIGATAYRLRINTRASHLDGTSRPFAIVDARDTVLTGRGALELGYELGRTEIVARYSFTQTADAAFSGRGNLGFQFEQRLSSHALAVGARYMF